MKKSILKEISLDKIENKDTFTFLMGGNIFYYISAKIATVKERILVLSFFNKNKSLCYRLFCSKKEYITQDMRESKWLTGKMENIIGYEWTEKCLIINKISVEVVLKFFKLKENPLEAIDEFQDSILEKKLERKHKKEMKEIDSIMRTVSKLPAGFRKWVDEDVLLHSRYIYYKYKNTSKPIKGYCTHCKQYVWVTNPKHNKKGICPHCKSEITYKSVGKAGCIVDKAACMIIQKVPTGIIERYFGVRKEYYRPDYKNPKLKISEYLRTFDYDKNLEKWYEFGNFKQTGIERWCNGVKAGIFVRNYNIYNIVLYNKNLDEVLQDTSYEYSQMKQYSLKHNEGFPVYDYLYYSKKYPFIEYLMKTGLEKIVDQIISGYYGYRLKDIFSLHGKNLFEVLKIDKNSFRRLKKLGPSLKLLEILQQSYKVQKTVTDGEISFITKNKISAENFFDAAEYATPHRIIKYINFQKNYSSNKNYILTDWLDYLGNCKLCKYDLHNDFVLFPKDLRKRHDEMRAIADEKVLELCNKRIKERYMTLSKLYNWKYKGFIIRVASSADELIAEGQNLHHCVGTYKEEMAKGKTAILFLRKAETPDKSFYTIEVKNNKIRQLRGYRDCDPTPEVKNVVQKFADRCKLLTEDLNKAA